MKRAWRWTLAYDNGPTFMGFCPVWAAQPVPEGATLTRERVMVIGTPVPCDVPGCGGAHHPL